MTEPIGVGYSYADSGAVDNTPAAAEDVYAFLALFFGNVSVTFGALEQGVFGSNVVSQMNYPAVPDRSTPDGQLCRRHRSLAIAQNLGAARPSVLLFASLLSQ